MDRSRELAAAFVGLGIRMPQALPGLRRLLILPGGGHWIGEERPDEVNAALMEFLGGL
jgi:pimeloyl-ACP methyl ester carboxylesterase